MKQIELNAFCRGKLTTKRSVQNPEYNFQPEPNLEEAEETYHVIDDNMVCRKQMS